AVAAGRLGAHRAALVVDATGDALGFSATERTAEFPDATVGIVAAAGAATHHAVLIWRTLRHAWRLGNVRAGPRHVGGHGGVVGSAEILVIRGARGEIEGIGLHALALR